MRVLITGAGGFVGGHLVDLLLTQPEVHLHAAVFSPPGMNPRLDGRPITQHPADLRDSDAVRALIDESQPDRIVHLAALADVGASFRDPWATLENNIRIQVNLQEALRFSGANARVLIIGSSEVYGAAGGTADPIDENYPFQPASPYSVSKVAQDMLGLQYFVAHGMEIIRVRPFNHIGPSQKGGFVAADFASQIAEIEAGQREPVMAVGNLTAERDFTDVRDVVRAYWLLLDRGTPGEAYNVCSGTSRSIQSLLDTLLSFTSVPIEVRQDPARMRPSDVPRRVGDAGKLRAATGWQPTIPFEQTLLDILNDWRQSLDVPIRPDRL